MTRRLDETEVRIYGRLVEGRSQAEIVTAFGLDKSKVNRVVKKLINNGYLIEKSIKPPKTYEKGPNGPLLDARLSRPGFSGDSHINDPGVTDFSPSPVTLNPAVEPSLDLTLVHHLRYRAQVLSEGDLEFLIEDPAGKRFKHPFLRKDKPIRGQDQYNGELEYDQGKVVGVGYQRPFKSTNPSWIYFYPPNFQMTYEECDSRKWEIIGMTYAQEVYERMVSWGKWELGQIARDISWKPHFGVHKPELKGYADRMTMSSKSGAVHVSNSDGRTELEVEGGENTHLLRMMVEGPEAIYQMECRLTDAERGLVKISEIIKRAVGMDAELTNRLIQIQAKLAELDLEFARTKEKDLQPRFSNFAAYENLEKAMPEQSQSTPRNGQEMPLDSNLNQIKNGKEAKNEA